MKFEVGQRVTAPTHHNRTGYILAVLDDGCVVAFRGECDRYIAFRNLTAK
jgi:hypothetical protein